MAKISDGPNKLSNGSRGLVQVVKSVKIGDKKDQTVTINGTEVNNVDFEISKSKTYFQGEKTKDKT